jgi:urease accessory protein
MRRVMSIRAAGKWDTASARDRVVLDAGDRQRRRIVLTGERGTSLLLDVERPVALRDGDGLVLDNGAIVAVAGLPERLLELATPTSREFVRLAWHLGNRHADVEISAGHIRVRRDHVLEEMATGLGASVAAVEAPFNPERGGS